LQFARLGLLHLFPDGEEVVQLHVRPVQGIAADDVAQMLSIQGTLDRRVVAGQHDRVFAVADGVDQ